MITVVYLCKTAPDKQCDASTENAQKLPKECSKYIEKIFLCKQGEKPTFLKITNFFVENEKKKDFDWGMPKNGGFQIAARNSQIASQAHSAAICI